ncbi:thioesterase II family protein [Lacrimispora sp.]|uniref:thioesterase II family protein n=1 Tax=Lacrimispora sp. TaxID=2719234 RepID=UPI003995BBE9
MSCVKKIIFFPHAGGLAYSYFKLARKVEENTGISTSVYEYAGRGERQKEAAFIDFKAAIESIHQDIYKNFPADNYIFFGHSMGSYIALEVAKYMMNEGKNVNALFVSGLTSPNFKKIDVNKMNDENIMRYLKVLNKNRGEIVEKESLKKMYMNIIKNDFLLINSYIECHKQTKPFKKLIVLYGLEDPLIKEEKLEEWTKLENEHFDIATYAGNHFYIFGKEEELGKDICGWI